MLSIGLVVGSPECAMSVQKSRVEVSTGGKDSAPESLAEVSALSGSRGGAEGGVVVSKPFTGWRSGSCERATPPLGSLLIFLVF